MERLSSIKNFSFLLKIFYYYDIIGRIKYSNHEIDRKTDKQDLKYLDESRYFDQYVNRLQDYVKEKIFKKYHDLKKIRTEISYYNSSNKFHNLFWDVHELVKTNEKMPYEPIKENCIHILIFENENNNLVFGATILLPPENLVTKNLSTN